MTASAPNVRWRARADSSVVSPSLWLRARVVVETKRCDRPSRSRNNRMLPPCQSKPVARETACPAADIAFGGKLRGRPPFGAGISSRSPARTQQILCLTVSGQTSVVAGPLVGSTNRAYPGGAGDGLIFGDRNGPRESGQKITALPSLRPSIKRRSGKWARQPERRVASIVVAKLKIGGRPFQLELRAWEVGVWRGRKDPLQDGDAIGTGEEARQVEAEYQRSASDPPWLIPAHG